MECLLETFLDTATIGVEQNKPIFTPGVAKAAVLLAYARSQLATNWQPAAVAVPLTSAITGSLQKKKNVFILSLILT